MPHCLASDKVRTYMQRATDIYSVSKKNPPLRTCGNFSKTAGNFSTKFYMPITHSYIC